MKVGAIDKAKLARTGDEFKSLVASDADWIVRSADDVRQLRGVKDSVFAKLPEADFYAFVDSLQFKNGGVVTGTYKPLMASLTLEDIFTVFENFGMDRRYLTETGGHEQACENHQWVFRFWSFCSSLCG